MSKSKLARQLLWLSTLLFFSSPSYSLGFEVNIMTGGASGTYIQIGRDVAGLTQGTGRTVNVVESAGSLENLEAVRDRRYTQFGIVQSDVLDFVRTFRAENAAMRRIARSTRIVFPLYNEEVHIVTRKSSGIDVLAGLSGRSVGVGVANSGTNLTATFLFEVAHVRPDRLITVSAGDALDQLMNGTIDAFVYVAGAPTKLLQDTSASDDLKIVPVTAAELGGYYGTSIIRAGTYPWLLEDVTTAAVRAVLMTFEFDPRRNDYFKQSCDAVTEVSYLIKQNLETLKQIGHPKWNQVDLSVEVPGWERAQCVEAALDPNFQPKFVSNAPSSSPQSCSELLNPIALQLCRMKSSN